MSGPAPPPLLAHGWELQVLPHLGGAIGALRHKGRDILLPAPDSPRNVLQAGCFPLVPFANRVAWGAFDWSSQSYRLPRNMDGHPHSLHGFGWQSAWHMGRESEASVTLSHRYDGSEGWPWTYRAKQRIELAPSRARLSLSIRNTGDEPMPAGLGLHPYFPLDAASRLRFRASRVRLVDGAMLPTEAAAADHFGDWSVGAPASGSTLIDNAYEGWTGSAQLWSDNAAIELVADGARVLHVYRPAAGDFVCLEPVTHLPDALNHAGIDPLSPGETRAIAVTITVAGDQ